MPEEETRKGIIRLRIKDVTQFFNSFDPDPFIERDLDDDAVEHITSWAREVPRHTALKLVVEITEPKQAIDHAAVIASAVENNFQQMAKLARNEFRQLMKRGRTSLAIGLSFLLIAVIVSNLIGRYAEESTFVQVLQETVIIGGWVAMWRPMEIFLYDWWPLRRKRKDFERLRDMDVEVKLPNPAV